MSTFIDLEQITGTLSEIPTIVGELSTRDTLGGTLSEISVITGIIKADFVPYNIVGSDGSVFITDDGYSFLGMMESTPLTGTLAVMEEITGVLTVPSVVGSETYTGDYTVTPGETAVVLQTNYKTMTDNVTIEPIPSNYGLITWNGSTLMVS